MERFGPARVDVDLVTLEPVRIGTPRLFFIHSDADAGLAKTLCQTQAADPASNDKNVKPHGTSML